MLWLLFALGSAFFAGITAILAKIGMQNINSTLATAIRTIVVLAFSWLMVFVVGSQNEISRISGNTLLFLILSGLSTGVSWLCYFKALKLGDVNKVAPIDKSSTVLTILLAFLFLGEPISAAQVAGVLGIGLGTLLMITKKETAGTGMQNTRKETVGAGIRNARKETAGAGMQNTRKETINGGPQNTKKETIIAALQNRAWLLYALLSALFASLTSIFGKIGVEQVESNLGTAIRTVVVLIMAWLMVLVTGEQKGVRHIDRKGWSFLLLSGITTGLSWLCYYRALQDGPASVVVPVDKLSILVTIVFSGLVLKEKLSRKAALGLVLILVGTGAMLL